MLPIKTYKALITYKIHVNYKPLTPDLMQLPCTCRSISIEYMKEYKLKGIKLYRFSPTAEVFANHTENPDNVGFCIPDETGCLGSGVLNVSPCKSK